MDWLAEHLEAGQTFEEYLAAAPAVLRAQIEMEAEANVRAKGGMFGQITSPLAVRLERMAIIEDRLVTPSFDEWRKDLQNS